MGWTEDRIELLRKLWQEGLSASQIAATLGGVTRNAVIGKAHRLGLVARPSPIKAPLVPRPAPTATVLTLTDRMCKWPIGDPRDRDFHFCGNASAAGGPYCSEHASRAYQAPARRSDEARSAVAVRR